LGKGPAQPFAHDALGSGAGAIQPPRPWADPTERQIAARSRFDGAVAAAGKGLSDILCVVCAGEGLPVAEKALAWPARSGKLVLGLALDRVADFYRIG
jgi:hypothetical protein